MSWALWITGAPGSGTSAIARAVAAACADRGQRARVLELDALRAEVVAAPRRSPEVDDLVARALVYLARLLTETGVPVIVDAPASPRAWRDLARAVLPTFAEVEIATSPCASAPDEPPASPDLVVDTASTGLPDAVQAVTSLALELACQSPWRFRPRRPAWAIWLTGLPGSGKTTLAHTLVETLARQPLDARVLDVADVRQGLAAGRRPSPAEEDLIHRVLVVAASLLAESGMRVVIDAVAARRAWRELGRARIATFAEVQLMTPLGLCCERERAVRWNLAPCPHGASPKAAPMEGLDVVLDYEYSFDPDLTLRTDVLDAPSAANALLRLAARLEHEPASTDPEPTEATMPVRDLMTRGLVTVRPTTTVTEARALMAKERFRHLLVTDAGRLVGMVTDRDIRLNLASPATSLSVWELNYLLARLTVAEVMTRSLIVVEPDREAREAAQIMLDHKIGALPVVDGGVLVGILTETDLVRAFARSTEPVAVGGH